MTSDETQTERRMVAAERAIVQKGLAKAHELQALTQEMKDLLYPEFYHPLLREMLYNGLVPCNVPPVGEKLQKEPMLVLVLGSKANVIRFQREFSQKVSRDHVLHLTDEDATLPALKYLVIVRNICVISSLKSEMWYSLFRMMPGWIILEPSDNPDLAPFVARSYSQGHHVCLGVESGMTEEQFMGAARELHIIEALMGVPHGDTSMAQMTDMSLTIVYAGDKGRTVALQVRSV